MWASRILENENANRDVVLTATIFHDVGYSISPENHPGNSATICRKYLIDNEFDTSFIDKVTEVVKYHENKSLLTQECTSIEQIILIEADCLDETGTLSILRDCMAEGKKAKQSYEQTYERLQSRSIYINSEKNPMITKTAKNIWKEKQNLYFNFIENLAKDLGQA